LTDWLAEIVLSQRVLAKRKPSTVALNTEPPIALRNTRPILTLILTRAAHGGMGIQESPTNGIKVVRTE
jgi:hypothetical protein